MHFFYVIVLSFHVGYSITTSNFSLQKNGSHNLLKLERSNTSVQRAVRCTPCEKDSNIRRPISNHLDSEYRGNGADNLGYDWSPMAWGGPAFPRRSKGFMGGMRGRDSRMMLNNDGRNQGNVRVICDTCRAYWDGDKRNGDGEMGRGRGRQFNFPGQENYYQGQPGYWQGNKMRTSDDYETRVMSPTVGVLVKPGSRIAYIPSRSGEMYWDGVSGGGTRWDGFSNGISWIGNAPEWDRSDSVPQDGPVSPSSGSNYPYVPYDNPKRPPNWSDNLGRGYYFSNGAPNDIDPQWRDRGYASNWHYGFTNQNGWNGNNMKWNYGGKQWPDNDRSANRMHFNSFQDRTYGPNDNPYSQYGYQYPNYQSGSGYLSNLRPQPSYPSGTGYRPNDKFPASFQPDNYGSGDKDRPWDYTSKGPFGQRRPGPRPGWERPGPGYPTAGNFMDNQEKFPNSYGTYNKFSATEKNDYDKPWNRPIGYGPSRPGSSPNFPYGNRYPDEEIGGVGKPSHSSGGGHLFFPNTGNHQPDYPSTVTGPEENRPSYSSGNRKPDEYPSSGGQGESGRPGAEYPNDKRPSIIYTGGRPMGTGSSSGGYPGGGGYPGSGSTSGGYPGSGSTSGGYPGSGSTSGGYPGSGSTSGGYPGSGSTSGGYPGSGSTSGGYPGSGSTSGGYPSAGNFVGGYPSSGGSPGRPDVSRPGYPSPSNGYGSTGSSYPSGISRPENYPSGGSYPENTKRPGSRPENYPSGGSYPESINRPGSRPDNYYGGGNPPGGYPSGGGFLYPRPSVYPVGGGSSYPNGNIRPGFYPEDNYPNTGYFGGNRPAPYPGAGRPGGYGGNTDGYRGSPGYVYPIRGSSPYYPGGSGGNKNPPKGYYTGFITELRPDEVQSNQYGGGNSNYFGNSYPENKNYYIGKDRNKYFNGGSYSNSYPSDGKNRYPSYSEDRYSGSGSGSGSGYYSGNNQGSDKFYYGKYPGGYPSNHRYPGSEGDGFDRNQGSNNDKNSWNYGQNEHKDGIYRRSGGSYPPYRGGQYFTSSYLASMSTTAGSTQAGTEPKTQSVTKPDEVTQPTSDSS